MASTAIAAAATPTEYVEDERIGDLLEQHKDRGPWFSFEFYPPKTADGVEKLYDRLGKMAPYSTCRACLVCFVGLDRLIFGLSYVCVFFRPN